MEREALDKAIRKAGGIKALADLLGVSESAVIKWRYGQKQALPQRAVDIERLLGVKRADLMPTIFGKVA